VLLTLRFREISTGHAFLELTGALTFFQVKNKSLPQSKLSTEWHTYNSLIFNNKCIYINNKVEVGYVPTIIRKPLTKLKQVLSK